MASAVPVGKRRPRTWRRWLALSGAGALLGAPVAAQAQSCAILRAQIAGNAAHVARLAYDYPRTHAAIVACYIGNDRVDEADVCAGAAVFAACLGMGWEWCENLTYRWEQASATYARIAARMRYLGCRQ